MVAVEEQETEELRSFRESWKREVQEKQRLQHPSQDAARPTAPPKPASASEARALSRHPRPLQSRNGALEVYIRAVKHEQAGELDEALRLYRQAFRMDPNIDRVYHLGEQRAARALEASAPVATSVGPEIEMKTVDAGNVTRGVTRTHTKLASSVAHHPDRHVSGVLARIVADFPEVLSFEAEDEKAPLFLQRLPDELLVHILRHLGTTTIERFACVSRKARVITLDAAIWRTFVETIYKPPQISPNEILDDIVDNYSSDYRRVYIERPRVRLDGVYIAVCHYIRHGLSENAWVNISHLITYHRYLRFYPNGQVISLLANEEHEPQQVITMLRPTLRMKGFYIGTWKLVGVKVHVSNLVDPSNPDARYSFQMTLTLRSRPLGRWNKLDFDEYESVNVEDGEATRLGLKNERPFWFSKVRSYSSRVE
ncbi:hypothetical protein BJY52DRAFT_91289 [Lactarius psammicola]|nr:hypothetical protein BJY52DRAFT_91289 [Lactarius psammicola]